MYGQIILVNVHLLQYSSYLTLLKCNSQIKFSKISYFAGADKNFLSNIYSNAVLKIFVHINTLKKWMRIATWIVTWRKQHILNMIRKCSVKVKFVGSITKLLISCWIVGRACRYKKSSTKYTYSYLQNIPTVYTWMTSSPCRASICLGLLWRSLFPWPSLP